jgi:phosphoribosylanthranilate isomerase
VFLKICGITRLEDATHAVASGASALGFVLWRRSPRYVTPEQVREIVDGLPAGTQTIGVFVDEPVDGVRRAAEIAGLSAVQLNDAASPADVERIGVPVFKVVTLGDTKRAIEAWPEEVTLLLDAHDPVRRGGTGTTVDWNAAEAIARRRRLVLAGGLTPANVEEAIARVLPFGVDVASGVESSPGVKDADKVARFLANARRAFEMNR